MRPALPALLFGVLLVTSGCLGVFGPGRPPSDERALDAINRSQAAVADVTSHRVSVDGHMDATAEDESLSFDIAGHGTVNVSERRLNVTIDARDTTRTTYVTGYTLYTECSRMGWGRENLTRSTRWLNYTPLGEQLALLDRTNVYWRGTESLDGVETAVVVARPTAGELRSVADGPGDGTTLANVDVQNATVTVWINTETGRPVQVRREIRVKRGGATARATVTFRFSAYNEPVEVTRPAFDADAVWEIGCPGS